MSKVNLINFKCNVGGIGIGILVRTGGVFFWTDDFWTSQRQFCLLENTANLPKHAQARYPKNYSLQHAYANP